MELYNLEFCEECYQMTNHIGKECQKCKARDNSEKKVQDNIPSEKMNEFLDKVDSLCFEYGYEIHPTIYGWTGEVDENGEYETIAIIGDNETHKVVFIDGDGRGK